MDNLLDAARQNERLSTANLRSRGVNDCFARSKSIGTGGGCQNRTLIVEILFRVARELAATRLATELVRRTLIAIPWRVPVRRDVHTRKLERARTRRAALGGIARNMLELRVVLLKRQVRLALFQRFTRRSC